jgi:hypothetical protein
MARNRPNSVFVIGILNMVFGGLGLLLSLCGAGVIAAMRYANIPGPNGQNIYQGFWEVMDAEVPNYFQLAMFSLVAGMLLLTILLIAGIGLIRMRRWGRTLSVFFAITFILLQTWGLIWSLRTVNPATQRAQAEMTKAMPPQQAQFSFQDPGFGAGIAVFFYAIELVYCIVLLVIMFQSPVRAAFAGTAVESAEREDYRDSRSETND